MIDDSAMDVENKRADAEPEGQSNLSREFRISSANYSVLLTCPLHTSSGYGKERRILIAPW